jgi:hypothetical protein
VLIDVCAAKGGAGATVVVAGLAAMLAARGDDVLVVDLDGDGGRDQPLGVNVPAVVVGTSAQPGPAIRTGRAGMCDLVVTTGELDRIVATVEANPIAATSYAVLLRTSASRSTDDGLHAESAVYSTLQAGPEFAAWRTGLPVRAREEPAEVVAVERAGDMLTLTLQRPHVHNALNMALRDQWLAGLALAAADPAITEVHLRGTGPAFSSGGDLDEFGAFADPATAHLVRLTASVGRAIDRIHDKVTAHLHGPCAGSGVELPAFAGRVLAHPDTTLSLPEVELGLVPGAGGTVSLPRRIGRHRTAELGLRGGPIDAATGLEWGLIDALEDA